MVSHNGLGNHLHSGCRKDGYIRHSADRPGGGQHQQLCAGGSTGGTTNSGDPDLEAYTMSSGALTSALTAATGTDPVGALAIAALQ